MADEATPNPQPEGQAPQPTVRLQMQPGGPPGFMAIPGFAPAALPLGVSAQIIAQTQVWQGQFPPPEAIERYEAVLPGTFDRIIRMAERQIEAQIEASTEGRRFQRSDIKRGQLLGFAVTTASLVGAIICAYLKQPVIAVALVSVPVMAVAKALVDAAKAPTTTAVALAPQTPPEPEKPPSPTP